MANAALQIEPIALLRDNYAYLLVDTSDGENAAAKPTVGIVDPSLAAPVSQYLNKRGLHLDYILNTHHHWDHTDGNLELKNEFGCKVVGPKHDSQRIPGIDIGVDETTGFIFGSHAIEILETPGHTTGAIVFYFKDAGENGGAAFTGDTLFSIGCGRMFEGNPNQFWDSLKKIRSLPDDTALYCGHEYTQANIGFAQSVDPANEHLKSLKQSVDNLRAAGKPSMPAKLSVEKAANPFLRADDENLQKLLGLNQAVPSSVFAELRSRKDRF